MNVGKNQRFHVQYVLKNLKEDSANRTLNICLQKRHEKNEMFNIFKIETYFFKLYIYLCLQNIKFQHFSQLHYSNIVISNCNENVT